jgi:hypothetical protein
MLAPLILAALLSAAAPAAAPPAPFLRIENARVTRVSPPAPDSGIFAVYRNFDVVLPGGQSHRLYVLWMSQNQYMPEAGAVCTIVYRREALLPGNMRRPQREGRRDEGPFNVVHELSCGFAPEVPVLGRNRPSA